MNCYRIFGCPSNNHHRLNGQDGIAKRLRTFNGCGVFYKLTPAGVFSVVYSFTSSQGASPSAIAPVSSTSFIGALQADGANSYGSYYLLTTH